MNRGATLHDIFDRVPDARADFADTKPFTATPADDIAVLFGAFGVQTLRASLVDLESMHCTHVWHISEDGAMVEDPDHCQLDNSFPIAMATIVHLNSADAEQTLARKVDSHCWAFAWPAMAHHVAVVEARYRLARSDHGDADTAFVRHVCDAGLASASVASATIADDPPASGPIVEPVQPLARSGGGLKRARAQDPTPKTGAGSPSVVPFWRRAPQRVVYVVLANGLAAAAILFAVLQSASGLRMESARLQLQADATMTQTVAKTLSEGDYGEVQAELASFASLNYFEHALVTNMRGRVIAATGQIDRVRMGDPLTADVAASARVIDLNGNAGRVGQLLVWDQPAQAKVGLGGGWLSTAALLIAVGTVAAAVALLLRRRQPRDTADR